MHFNYIQGKFLRIIYNLYENIKSCMKISGEFSQPFACNCGVRQGENLSPILFSIYLNDLENFLLSSNISSHDLETISNEINIYLRRYCDFFQQ